MLYSLRISIAAFADDLSLQISWTFLSTLADLGIAVVWMISICTAISNSSSLLPKLLGLFQVHQLLSLFSSKVLIFISLFAFFDFYSMVPQNGKIHSTASSLFFFFFLLLLISTRSGLLARIRWSDCITKSQII